MTPPRVLRQAAGATSRSAWRMRGTWNRSPATSSLQPLPAARRRTSSATAPSCEDSIHHRRRRAHGEHPRHRRRGRPLLHRAGGAPARLRRRDRRRGAYHSVPRRRVAASGRRSSASRASISWSWACRKSSDPAFGRSQDNRSTFRSRPSIGCTGRATAIAVFGRPRPERTDPGRRAGRDPRRAAHALPCPPRRARQLRHPHPGRHSRLHRPDSRR